MSYNNDRIESFLATREERTQESMCDFLFEMALSYAFTVSDQGLDADDIRVDTTSFRALYYLIKGIQDPSKEITP